MIVGKFERATGLPVVSARFWLFDAGTRVELDCVLDITRPRTALSTSRLAGLQPSAGTDTDVRAILTLEHGDGTRSGFLLDVHITEADYSRLGRDVLERTVMVYDPRGGNLLIDVLEAGPLTGRCPGGHPGAFQVATT